MSNRSETSKKTSSLIEVLNQKVQQLVDEAVSTEKTITKPIAINGTLRVSLLAFKDGTVMFSIAKLSQGKAIVITHDDLRFLLEFFNTKYDEVDTLLAVVSKYAPKQQKVSISEETLF